MTKLQTHFAEKFKDQFISWPRQRESGPDFIVNIWVSNIHEWWLSGQINLKDYQSLLRVDIFNA